MSDVLAPVVAVRIGLLVLGGLLGPALAVAPADVPAGLPEWIRVWDRWDGPHYLDIAAGGYDPAGDPALAAFLPLHPASCVTAATARWLAAGRARGWRVCLPPLRAPRAGCSVPSSSSSISTCTDWARG